MTDLLRYPFCSWPKRWRAPAVHVVRTTRNSAFPLIMRAYPSGAFARGIFSIMGRSPVISAKTSVSWESVGMPAAQPLMPSRRRVPHS